MMPQKDIVFHCLEMVWFLLFPEHFPSTSLAYEGSAEEIVRAVTLDLKKSLRGQVERALSNRKNGVSVEATVEAFVAAIPSIRQKLLLDAQAAVQRDPSVESLDEVIVCYPGFLALMTYRVAHDLSRRRVPLIPRMMSEMAHARTGCDIHPDAVIGESLFIDHATGVVIGQTAVVGDRVTIFQGVTLGAIALQEKGAGQKRHPTIEDDVVIYSNATILGGETVIGKRSVIGGSCWITYSVPPDTKVILANPRSLVTQSQKKLEDIPNWDI